MGLAPVGAFGVSQTVSRQDVNARLRQRLGGVLGRRITQSRPSAAFIRTVPFDRLLAEALEAEAESPLADATTWTYVDEAMGGVTGGPASVSSVSGQTCSQFYVSSNSGLLISNLSADALMPASTFRAPHHGRLGVGPVLEKSLRISILDEALTPTDVVAITASDSLTVAFGEAGQLEPKTVRLETVLGLQVEQTFRDAAKEDFEVGVESAFDRALTTLVRTFGNDAVRAVEQGLDSISIDFEVATETLRRIGAIEHPPSQKYRLSLLVKHLQSVRPRLRYAAAVGLAALDDPAAIPAILQALSTESQKDVQRCLKQALVQLEDTLRCRNT